MRCVLLLLVLAAPSFAESDPKPCAPAVRAALARVKKAAAWGPFEFECREGRVAKLAVDAASPIAARFPEFARQNAALFGLKASELGEGSAELGLPQLFHGVAIYRTAVGWRWNEGDSVELHARLRETRGWKTSVKPAIKAEEAVAAARELWKDVGVPKQGLSSTLMLSAGELKCGEAKKPALVWVVSGEREEDCLIRADDAKPCGICWYDEAQEDRAERD